MAACRFDYHQRSAQWKRRLTKLLGLSNQIIVKYHLRVLDTKLVGVAWMKNLSDSTRSWRDAAADTSHNMCVWRIDEHHLQEGEQ